MEHNQILTTCLELEGLLSLVEKRSASDRLNALIVEKAELLYNAVRENFGASALPTDDLAVAASVMAEEEADADLQPVGMVSLPSVVSGERVEEEHFPASDNHENENPQVSGGEQSHVLGNNCNHVSVRNDKINVEFTLNDKFRFRRELFANSDVDMADAIQVASGMNSREELEDYFYNDLCWDPENPTVSDFLRIVGRRFI